MMRKHLLAVAVSGAAALALASPVADAAPSQSKAPAGVAVKHLDASKAEHDRIVAYWTPQRMRAAIPADVLVADRDKSSATGNVAAGRPYVVQPQAKPGTGGGAGSGSYYTGGGNIVKTTGKVFFTMGGGNYVCSGSSTASNNHDVVTTAGHCVNEGPGAYVINFAFVPAYDDGARPYGTFTARALATTDAWANDGDFDYDVGFAVVNPPANSVDLTDRVGSQGIGFNLATGQEMYSFGYPAARPYDGTDIAYCFGTVFPDTYGGSSDQGMNCNMTGGSSGGPWLQNYNTTNGGTIASVNSFGYRGVKNIMWGPYFGSVIQSTYNAAQSL
ncbi:MAG TPA: hypothetical protein VLI04_03585 [Nocardioidaceae bacterium]|nr:hypothetical protein [Nocardioidaceae bacterium]